MSNRVQGGQRAGSAKGGRSTGSGSAKGGGPAKGSGPANGGGSSEEVPLTKPEKRALAKKAAAKRAAAQRRKKLGIAWISAVLVLGAILAIYFGFYHGKSSDNTAAPGASASAGASNTAAAFPPLPAGADPALGSKPEAKAGTGELTKLTVTPLIEGKGAAVANGQNITVNYVGVSYKTGQEFDASWTRKQPFSFALGGGNVIKGWDQGLVGVKVGSRVQLDIPADLAYGDNPAGGQPAGPLRFVVDVLAAG